jgi:hypothetical protein
MPEKETAPEVVARIAQIERDIRQGKHIDEESILWLIHGLRLRLTQLAGIEAEVRRICKNIDRTLEKCMEVKS